MLFYVCLLIAVFIFNIVWILKYTWLLANSTLALIAWISLIIQQPFTIQYAKEMVSPDKWKHPIFLRINNIITLVWALSFTVGALLNLLRMYEPTLNGWAFEMLTYVPSVFAIAFTTWFPEWYKKQLVDSTSATKI